MSAVNSVRMNLEERFRNISQMPWSKELPIAFTDFAHDCRCEALQFAYRGNFSEAFSLISLSDSIWVQNETQALWSDFYVSIAKAILIQAQQGDALSAIRDNKRRIKSLQATVPHLSPAAALRLLDFLAKCKQPLRSKL